jgi:hypothetical protein
MDYIPAIGSVMTPFPHVVQVDDSVLALSDTLGRRGRLTAKNRFVTTATRPPDAGCFQTVMQHGSTHQG